MTTTIEQYPHGLHGDGVQPLLDLLKREPLHPGFEAYGNFCYRPKDSRTGKDMLPTPRGRRFWGNFWGRSFLFHVDTDDPKLVAKLRRAIRANQRSAAYRAAKQELEESKAKERARREAQIQRTRETGRMTA